MYSPTIDPRQVMALYQLKQKLGRPMTRMVKEAIDEWVAKQKAIINSQGNEQDRPGREKGLPTVS